MTTTLEGILVTELCVVVTFQGPKGNAANELWLLANGLVEM